MPIRALCGPAWRCEGIFYVQVGAEDNPTLSGLPPGAVLSIEPVSMNEQSHPDPKAIYCLQFADGYRCCGCAVSAGKLSLLPYSYNYFGKYQFFYPQEVRIVGRARGFAVRLPSAANEKFEESRYHGGSAPLVLPWEQPSLSALLRSERLRFGLTKQASERANEILHSLTGTTLSLRTLRRYEHGTQTTPRTDVLVALALVHCACFSDVLRLLGLWQDESDRYSLKTWLSVTTLDELQTKEIRSAVTPEPHHRWQIFLKDWGEWPTVLSMAIPGMEQFQHLLLRIHQESDFTGLIPLIHSGAIGLVEEVNGIPELRADREKSEWDRPIYVIRHKQNILCGYLDYDGEYIALVPHPRTSARRLSFLRHQVDIVGKLIGVASPLPHER